MQISICLKWRRTCSTRMVHRRSLASNSISTSWRTWRRRSRRPAICRRLQHRVCCQASPGRGRRSRQCACVRSSSMTLASRDVWAALQLPCPLPGPAEDMNAWLYHYVTHHPQLMRGFPGIRHIEVLSRLDWCGSLPWPRVDYMQRNRVMFDSPSGADARAAIAGAAGDARRLQDLPALFRR